MGLRGSCLCGGVAFEVDPPFETFVNCHCSRCRKASGAAYAANALVAPAAIKWTRGEHLVNRFDLPDAKSFSVAFCRCCGSQLPHLTRSGAKVIIPAGAFDDPLNASPDRHMHWASRANWFAFGNNLPASD